MALTDFQEFPSDRALRVPGLNGGSLSALARLSQIHAESSETEKLGRFIGSAVPAAAALLALGALAVMFAGGADIKQEFAWSLLMLAGVGAMLRTYIKSVAQAFDRVPLREAAKDLRAIWFYSGFVWGAGAFLLLGDNPVPIMGLCFALAPSLILLALLRDKAANLSFLVPVTVLTAAAMLLDHWGGLGVALAMLLVVQGSIIAGMVLSRRARETIPAGLSLR